MQRSYLSRITGILTILSLLLLPSSPAPVALAEPAAGPDDEIIYIDAGNFIRVIDPNVEPGTQEILWSSPEGIWFDFATGDFNNDGDKEIVAIGGGRLTVFDPVVRDTSIVPDDLNNLVPWKRLHERALNNADIVAAGNLVQGSPGDEILVGYNVSEGGGITYRVDILNTPDGGRTWNTHATQGYAAKWNYIKVGNINNAGSDDLLMGRTTAGDSLVEAREVDNNFATIFSRSDSTLFTQSDGSIGQVYGGGTGEAVFLRTFAGTTEAAVMLIYQFINGSWQVVEDPNNQQTDDTAHFFPHPLKIVTGDINGNGDDEIVWLRDAPLGNNSTVRMVMINRGNDQLPAFESPLDSDNGYRVIAMGDPDGDGRKEIVLMRNNRIVVFTAPETGNTGLTRDYPGVSTNLRSLKLANLDGPGYTAGARFSATPDSLSVTLEAGTTMIQNFGIQITNIGSGGSLPISVSKEQSAPWFDFAVGVNATPASIFVTRFDASNLAPGTYRDRLRVTSSNTSVLNQPFFIPIELIVTPATFNISPAFFGMTFKTTETMPQTSSVTINGLPGLTFSAAILSKPELNAATAALGGNPTSAWFAESGALVLANGTKEYTTSVSRIASDARATSANSWPSAFPWASASSASAVVPATITVAISPTLMTSSLGQGILLVMADKRAGAFPQNVKMSEFTAIATDTPFYMPIVFR